MLAFPLYLHKLSFQAYTSHMYVMLDYNNGSGYSSSPGRQVIHAIHPARPCDTKHDALLT